MLLQLDRGSLGMGAEGLGLNPAARQGGKGVPHVPSQKPGTAEAERCEISVRGGVDMGDVPLVVAAQEGLTHAVEDLGGVARERTLPEQHRQTVLGRVGPDFHWPAAADIGHFVHHRDLLDMGPVQGSAQ